MLEKRMVTMSARELRRIEVLSQLQDGNLRVEEAAGIMDVSVRHAYRLFDRFSAGGAKELVHRGRGKQSNRKTSTFRRDYILDLVRAHYHDFGPTLAAEILFERHEIKVSREALRTWMIEGDIWLPRKARKRFHQPRLRREYFGELVQIDGSEHRWLEDRGPKCTLLVFIDDATSALLALRFVPSESTESYFAILRNYLEEHGRPVSFYSDKHSVFKVNKKNAKGGAGMTQFGRALQELNIEILCANSSSAKGRVERANRTLQDRLIKAMRLDGIDNIDAGNAYLPQFIDRFNAQFAKPPYRNEDRHRPLDSDMHNLDDILTIQETRYLGSQLVFNYKRKKYMIEVDDFTRGLVGKYVDIFEFFGAPLSVRYQGHELRYNVFDKDQRVNHTAIVENKRLSAVLAFIKDEQDNCPAPVIKNKTNSERIGYTSNGGKRGRPSVPKMVAKLVK